MNPANLLARTAAVFPDRPALFHGDRQRATYGELAAKAARIAGGLLASGLAPGDRVAIFMRNLPEYFEALHAAWWAGLAVVPINAKLHAREAAFIVANSEARALVYSRDAGDPLVALRGEMPSLAACIDVEGAAWAELARAQPAGIARFEPDDLAWLFYTSGTTGRPKGVMITARNIMTMTLCYFADVDRPRAQDASVYAAPISHGAGLYAFPNIAAGAKHVVPESGGFEPAELFALSRSHGSLSMFAAPTMVKRLVDHAEFAGESGEGFRTIVYGGGPMYAADIKRAMRVMGPRFVQIYGQGESPMTITALSREHLLDASHPRHEERIASVGVAQTAVEVRVADAQGRPLPVGETGEVLVRGDSVMKGYWRNPEATAAAIRDGWLFTGDVGSLDADGFLTLKDRSKDVVISGGSNIYPREVEEVLLLHPGVAEVSVVGAPDAEWGEVVVAFVVAREGVAVDPHELDELCLDRIARFKRPKSYRFLPALPKNNYGKVVKTELRAMLAAAGN